MTSRNEKRVSPYRAKRQADGKSGSLTLVAKSSNVDQFIETVAKLRAPDGCPWDREQTHKTLARYLLEETYEVLDAIHNGDAHDLRDELGDLLLQIVLNAQVAKDCGEFDIEDVAGAINKKMIHRHPHVFSNEPVNNAQEVLVKWADLKEKELSDAGKTPQSALDGIPPTLPALMQTQKISEKAVRQGFEWQNEDQVWEKLFSELTELKEAISHPDMKNPERAAEARGEMELELGDVLFTIVNIGRWHGINAEEALLRANAKFQKRFRKMEEVTDTPLKKLSFEQLDDLWNQAKALTAKQLDER